MTASGKHRPMGARELVLLALLGALLLVTKLALAWLPNIEPVSLLVLVYTAVLGWKALAPVYVYVMMEILIWGLGFWNLCYTYVWLVLVVLAMLFRKMESPLGSALRGLRAQLRGAVRPSVLGHRRMGLRPVLVGKRHPLRSAPLRRKLRHGAGAVPALQTGADPSDAHINEERRPIGRRSLFIACTPHTALGRRAS